MRMRKAVVDEGGTAQPALRAIPSIREGKMGRPLCVSSKRK